MVYPIFKTSGLGNTLENIQIKPEGEGYIPSSVFPLGKGEGGGGGMV